MTCRPGHRGHVLRRARDRRSAPGQARRYATAHRDKITSNCICPAVVDTATWTKIDADWAEIEGLANGEAWKRRIALIPYGRPETPEDLAGVVSFLASSDSHYMTGQAINVDGGLIMGN